MSLVQLSGQNPWWVKKEAINKDFHISQLKQSSVDWHPRLSYYFNMNSDIVYTLRGPRQVGKTTLIKIKIKELIEQGIDPRRIFYYTCDIVEGANGLVKIVQQYLNYSREFSEDRRYLFLDEISSVRDWQRGIKFLWDTGKLTNITLIMTGSHSLDVRKAAERLPGRRGSGEEVLDKILVPMKFVEYVETRDKQMRTRLDELQLISFKHRKAVLAELTIGNIPRVLEELDLNSSELSTFLNEYLLTGGISKAISDYVKYGSIRQETYSTYVNATIGDINRWNKKETYLVQLLRRVFDTVGTQVSWRSLQNGTDISNPTTVADYIDVLKSSFVLCPVYVLDREKRLPVYDKEKKIVFHDPFIFHALRGWVKQTASYSEAINFLENGGKSKLIESVIGDHLIRLAFSLNPSADYEPTHNVMYWKSKRDEVDYVIKFEKEYLPVEVKYTSSFTKSDVNGVYSFTRTGQSYRGVVVTKDLLSNEKDIVAIPAYLMLLLA